MFGINGPEFIVLAVLALIVVGPDKLPRYAADAARMLRRLREMADSARSDVRRELGPEFRDISLSDLNPRSMVRKHVLDPIEIDDLNPFDGDPFDESDRPTRRSSGDNRARGSRGSRDKPPARRGPGQPPAKRSTQPPPYDADAT